MRAHSLVFVVPIAAVALGALVWLGLRGSSGAESERSPVRVASSEVPREAGGQPDAARTRARASGARVPFRASSLAGPGATHGEVDAGAGPSRARRVRGEATAVAVADTLNEFVMPEARACIAAAQARDAELEGELALSFALEPDPHGGSVVGSFEPLDANEIVDEELLACVHASLDAAVFPDPTGPEPETLALSLHVSPSA